MKAQELLRLFHDALAELCKKELRDLAFHDNVNVSFLSSMDRASQHFTIKASDGTKARTYKITIELEDEF